MRLLLLSLVASSFFAISTHAFSIAPTVPSTSLGPLRSSSAFERPSRLSISRRTSHLLATPSKDVATIQILMSDTGGGHRASANALSDAFDELYPGKIQVDIVDIFTEYGPFFPLNAFVPIYKIMAEYPFLWGATYYWGANPIGLWFNELILETFCFEPFKDCMARPSGDTSKRADMVVSVHPLTQDIPLRILNFLDSDGKSRNEGRTTPFATVVTDLGGAHPTWFNPGVDSCFVPSDALYQCALDRKVRPEQIVQHGLPIRRGFWADQSSGTSRGSSSSSGSGNFFGDLLASFGGGGKDASSSGDVGATNGGEKSRIRDSLGLLQGLPTVLIVGGGDGMGGIIEQANALGDKLNSEAASSGNGDEPSFQMVVVCGKNENAEKKLSAKTWGKGVSVEVKGFVNNMDEWMRSSDVIVTKAGPGTIAEASICGLPCMLSSYLPGQEEGNVPFVEKAGFGTYSGNPSKIADTVSSWLSSGERLASMQKAALAAARPSATIDIAKDLAEMLFEHKDAVSSKIEERELVSQ